MLRNQRAAQCVPAGGGHAQNLSAIAINIADFLKGGIEERGVHRHQRAHSIIFHVRPKIGAHRVGTRGNAPFHIARDIGQQVIFNDIIMVDAQLVLDQRDGEAGTVLAGKAMDKAGPMAVDQPVKHHPIGLRQGRAEGHLPVKIDHGVMRFGGCPDAVARIKVRSGAQSVAGRKDDFCFMIIGAAAGVEFPLTVAAQIDDGGTRIGVRDTGCGMEPEHLPRIFERFYRADPGRSREAGGTGLGLAIVRHLAESHEGTVKAESQPGIGTTISAWIPSATPANDYSEG